MTQLMWTFYDPVASETYAMEINPAARTSMEPLESITPTDVFDRNIWQNPDPTKEGWGFGTWQEVTPPTQFTFQGTTYTEQQHNALLDWFEKQNRFQLTDHFGWTWEVIFTKYDARLASTRRQLWRHKYTITGLVFGQVT